MALTIPRIALPISVAASSGPHVTILYDDGTSENVTIGTGAAQTFFVHVYDFISLPSSTSFFEIILT